MLTALQSDRQSGPQASQARRGFRSGGNAFPKAVVVQLAVDYLARTDGTTTPLATVLDLPDLAECGPMINRMRVHWVSEAASTYFTGKVQIQWSAIGRTWSTPQDLISAQTGTQTQVIGNWFTNDAHFGLHLQFLLVVANSQGTAMESGRVTAFLEVEFKS